MKKNWLDGRIKYICGNLKAHKDVVPERFSPSICDAVVVNAARLDSGWFGSSLILQLSLILFGLDPAGKPTVSQTAVSLWKVQRFEGEKMW